jgi:CRISPR type III-A-associated RAMP protein Csm4
MYLYTLHFSRLQNTFTERIPSFTIVSAFLHHIYTFFDVELGELWKQRFRQGSVVLSSAFPIIDYGGKPDILLRFNVLAFAQLVHTRLFEVENKKLLKNAFVSLSDLITLYNSVEKLREDDLIQYVKRYDFGYRLLVKNKVGQDKTELYSVLTSENLKLGFLAHVENNLIKEFEDVLADLGEVGILADKSVGFGRFYFKRYVVDYREGEGKDVLLLSPFVLRTEQQLEVLRTRKSAKCLWSFGTYIGVHEGGGLKKPLLFIKEGSIVPASLDQPHLYVEEGEKPYVVYANGLRWKL